MKLSTRIARTLAVATIAVSGSMAVAPHLAGAVQGPGDISNPPTCTHGCGGGGSNFDGPGDLTAPTPPPVVDPQPGGDVVADAPIVVAQPTFTG